MPIRLVTTTLAAVLAVPSAHAGGLEQAMANCRTQEQAAERLACYDRLPVAVAGKVFTGFGNGLTAPFRIETVEVLRIESADIIMVGYLLREDGSVALNLHKGGQGTLETLIAEPGRYSLQINASGAWKAWLSPI